jgi:hypothetical protein
MIERIVSTKELKEAFFRIFGSTDPFIPAGHPDVPIKAVLYPTESYHLSKQQFQALIKASLVYDERVFFISEIEGNSNPFDKGFHWICNEPTFTEYTNLPIGIENAIYSKSGKWGLLLSHELHALLVCDIPFWETFQQLYPEWKFDQEKFIKDWESKEKEFGSNIGWLKPFISHLTRT